MKTLKQIQNQKTETKLRKLKSFIKKYGKHYFEPTKNSLIYLFNEAGQKADGVEPYAEEKGFKLYEVEVEYFGYSESKDDYTHHITVYIADHLDEETGDYTTYYSL